MDKFVKYRRMKGMTLVELVAAMAIFGVILAAILTLFMTGLNFFKMGNNKSQAQSDARLAVNAIIENIKFASEMQIMTSAAAQAAIASGSLSNFIFLDSGTGTMYLSEYNISTAAHINKRIARTDQNYTLTFSKVDNKTLRITVTVVESSETYTVETELKLDNFVLNPALAISGTESTAIMYKVKPPGGS